MKENVFGSGIDGFRLPAAFLVAAIHLGPLACWSAGLDFLFSYCLARLAVPFFLMTTGFFVLAPWLENQAPRQTPADFPPQAQAQPIPRSRKAAPLGRFLRRTLLAYLAAVLLYLPLQAYAGNLPGSLEEALGQLLVNGTFYHLWYFPAVITGCLLMALALPRLELRKTGVLALLLFLIGLLGDSWFGLAQRLPALDAFYQGIFTVSTYTRNGLFYTPAFLFLGVLAARRRPVSWRLGLALSLCLLLAEGWLTYSLGWQRHNSMYLALLPASWFLFAALLSVRGRDLRALRPVSMGIYLLHPLVIVLVRGGARVLGLWSLLVKNTFLHWLAVCLASLALAAALACLQKLWKGRKYGSKEPRLD